MSDPVAVPRKLVVRLEGLENPIGMLEDASDGSGYRIRFVYARGYRGPAPSASMPPRTDPYEDAAARAFFDNLPPEGARRRNVVPGKTAGARPFDEDDVVGLLSVLGRECPGAVMVIPEEAPPPKVPGVLGRDYAPLTDQEVERMLRRRRRGDRDNRRRQGFPAPCPAEGGAVLRRGQRPRGGKVRNSEP